MTFLQNLDSDSDSFSADYQEVQHHSKRNNNIKHAVKDQLHELLFLFEKIIDDIPLKSRATKMKNEVNHQRNKLIKLIKRRKYDMTKKFKLKTTEYRIGVQKSIRVAITGDVNRSIRRHIHEPPQIKLADKLSFTISLIHVILSEALLLLIPHVFQYYYICILIPLMLWRYFDYKEQNYHYFLFDFCYFVNFLAVCHIFLFNNSSWFFEALFVLSNGPVMLAIFIWRNSMVFHSIDKMTSLSLHTFPPMYTFCYQWLSSPDSYARNKELTFYTLVIYPTFIYFLWQISYLIKTEVLSKDYLEQNEDVQTSLTWFANDYKNGMNKYMLKVCRKWGLMAADENFNPKKWKTKFIYILLNFLYFFITIWPTYLCFKYSSVHLVIVLSALLYSIWNGANYYIEIFAARYENSLERKAAELEKKYLLIDENLDRLLDENWKDIQSDNDTDYSFDEHSDEYDDDGHGYGDHKKRE